MLDGHDLMSYSAGVQHVIIISAFEVNTGFVKPIAKGLLVVHPRRSRKLTTEVMSAIGSCFTKNT